MASIAVDLHPAAEVEAPRHWPRIYSRYRRFPMRNFPFNIIYLELTESVVVMVVAHHRQRPGYWLSRK